MTFFVSLVIGFSSHSKNSYLVPDLPYEYDALEPYIDRPTMKFHHDQHHTTYVSNLNKATNNNEENISILDRMSNAFLSPPIRNNGGGHYNHALFWKLMAPPKQSCLTKPSKKLSDVINSSFGSFAQMKRNFEEKAAPGAIFGSGWLWVCVDSYDGLNIVGTPNQDNPLMNGATDRPMIPILGIDVWEHAYYLKYQNRRPDYVKNWWNIINWERVNENFDYVLSCHKGVPV